MFHEASCGCVSRRSLNKEISFDQLRHVSVTASSSVHSVNIAADLSQVVHIPFTQGSALLELKNITPGSSFSQDYERYVEDLAQREDLKLNYKSMTY